MLAEGSPQFPTCLSAKCEISVSLDFVKKEEVRKEKNIPIMSNWPQIFRMYNITMDYSKWRKKEQKADVALS